MGAARLTPALRATLGSGRAAGLQAGLDCLRARMDWSGLAWPQRLLAWSPLPGCALPAPHLLVQENVVHVKQPVGDHVGLPGGELRHVVPACAKFTAAGQCDHPRRRLCALIPGAPGTLTLLEPAFKALRRARKAAVMLNEGARAPTGRAMVGISPPPPHRTALPEGHPPKQQRAEDLGPLQQPPRHVRGRDRGAVAGAAGHDERAAGAAGGGVDLRGARGRGAFAPLGFMRAASRWQAPVRVGTGRRRGAERAGCDGGRAPHGS
jgi:hypothetical protein